jgi:transposase
MTQQNYPLLGIDVSKLKLDACLLMESGQQLFLTVKNTAQGHAKLAAWLEKQGPAPSAACMEATNTYSIGIALFLYERAMTVYVANPLQVHSFMQVQLRRVKTDKADAALLADFVEAMHGKLWPWQPPPEHYQELRDLVRHLYELIRSRTVVKNRMEKVNYLTSAAKGPILRSLNADLRHFQKEIRLIRNLIEECLRTHEDLSARYALLTSAPGIGEMTALTFMAEVPNIQQFASAKQLACYAGVTPRVRHSGTHEPVSQPISKIGNTRLRYAFFMAALSASRYNQSMIPFAKRLQEHKKPMVVHVAVERKLLHLVYAMEKHQRPFDPNYQKMQPMTGTV